MIKEFQDIVSLYDIPEKILQNIENDVSGNGKREVKLTALQKEVINHPEFWSKETNNKNLIVQGATSSGKTLVAELLALQNVFSMNKQVVYLVPLKALVSEKVNQFKRDITELGNKIRINIFASSSDYQDHDTELAEGQYDIAVVVYEKFFAMLAEQKNNKFLEKCGLIIVDEMQLIGSQDRGAKLEYSLTKVRNMYGNTIRILGLTTVDCDTNYVASWLDATIVKNGKRPIGLRERIISLNGVYWERQISGENDLDIVFDISPQEGKIEIDDVEKLQNQKVDVKRNALLISLLSKIYKEDPQKKIIVFTNSRHRCKIVAKNIAKSNVFGKLEIKSIIANELEKSDDESERNLLENELLPYGIAYHNAALPMSLREVIEREFKENDGSVRLLVATETITIGMNLPADVMILYDNKVFRGADGAVDLRPQEYKNYIGRAGRLGITDKIGESYLFVNTDSDIRYYWNQYVNCKIENISSALVKSTPRECAPYFLNLLCKGKEESFSESTIEALAKKTLNASEAVQKDNHYSIDTDKIIRDFKKVELVRARDYIEDELDEDENSFGYKLTPFGEMLAPYALSIETCFRIKKYFRDDGDEKLGSLPINYSSKDLRDNKYILDILFLVCKMPEVRKITHPCLPDRSAGISQRNISAILQKAIIAYFNKEKKEKGDDAFWKNSEILATFTDSQVLDDDQLTPALRAILLYHWIKGEKLSDIKNSTGLGVKEFTIHAGDLARIGESCSYVIEAISRCLATNPRRVEQIDCGEFGALEHAFYSLAEKLKYGLANHSLIQIANRHVYGLSRNSIIKMDEIARGKGYENVNLFIRSADQEVYRYLTKSQRDELLKLMRDRYEDRNIENLIGKIIEDRIVDFSLDYDFKALLHSRDRFDWINSLKEILAQLDNVRAARVTASGYLPRIQWNDRIMHIVPLFGKETEREKSYEEYRNELKAEVSDKIVFIYNKDHATLVTNDEDVIISSEYFCKILLEFLALSNSSNGSLIFDYLYSQSGPVSDKGIGKLQKEIEIILSGKESFEEEDFDYYEQTAYDMYISKFNYIDKGDMASTGHAVMHKAVGKHDRANYIIKEIVIPENQEQYNILNRRAEEIFDSYCTTGSIELKSIIEKVWPEIDISDEDLKNIAYICTERKKQLLPDIVDKDRYFVQSLTFYMEGYKRLREVRIVAGISGAEQSHLVVGHNPEMYHEDYYSHSPEFKEVDSKFNKLMTRLFFAMRAMEGTLDDKRYELYGNKSEIISIAKQISSALLRCHSIGILHRDIKPSNILFTNEHTYCLCDFGCATSECSGKTIVGSIGYMAPETYKGIYTEKSDLYSLGITLMSCYVKNSNDMMSDEDDLLIVLRKACDDDPKNRYENVQEFLEAINLVDH